MRAICFPSPGGNPELMEIPVPQIDADDVLLKMHAVGVGLHDRFPNSANPPFPHPLGFEGSGVIEAVGDAVTACKPGDRVMVSGVHAKGGTWAEFAAINAALVMPMPEGLGFKEAAALPVAGGTGLNALRMLGLKPGQSLFIAGASGAIGTFVIQVASMRGCRVAGSASAANHAYLRSLGAELAVDYHQPDWTQDVKKWMPDGVDAAIAIQPGTGQASLPAIRDNGQVITISGDQVQTERGIDIRQVTHSADTRPAFLQLAADVASGKIRAVIEQVYPFERAVEALERTEMRHARGKLVVTIIAD